MGKKGNKSRNIVVFICEGYTEVYFYKNLINWFKIKKNNTPLPFEVHYINANGYGNVDTKAINKFNKLYEENFNKNDNIQVFLCLDKDVFKFGAKPYININKITKRINKKNVKKTVIYADDCIEAWFLKDLEGISKYLNISLEKIKKIKNKNSVERLKTIFNRVNKTYIKKGKSSEEFINYLNLDLICKSVGDLKEILDYLNNYNL